MSTKRKPVPNVDVPLSPRRFIGYFIFAVMLLAIGRCAWQETSKPAVEEYEAPVFNTNFSQPIPTTRGHRVGTLEIDGVEYYIITRNEDDRSR